MSKFNLLEYGYNDSLIYHDRRIIDTKKVADIFLSTSQVDRVRDLIIAKFEIKREKYQRILIKKDSDMEMNELI